MQRLILFCSLLLLITTVNCQPKEENKPDKLAHYQTIADSMISSVLGEEKGYEMFLEMCEIGPRLGGSEELLQAIDWAKAKFEAMGVDSVWLQPVEIPLWVRGDIETASITNSDEYEGRELNIASLGRSVGTPADGITAQVVEVKSLEEAAALGDKAKGKIILYNRPLDKTKVNTFYGYGGAVDQRAYGAIEAAKVGALGVLVRSISTQYDNVPHVGVMRYEEGVTQIPASAIGQVDADFLSKAIKDDPNLEVTMIMDCANKGMATTYNVIAEITGTEYPEEIIVVSGHYDSWDKGDGAHDDGAPSIQTMEVIDLFKRLDIENSRTIRCVLFANEEQGAHGGNVYGEFVTASADSHLAAIESDRGAFTPRGFTVDASQEVIDKMNTWLPVLRKSLIDWVIEGYGGVDINRIEQIKAKIGYAPDAQRYMDVHHSDNDTRDTVHPREFELGVSAMAILTYLISEEGL